MPSLTLRLYLDPTGRLGHGKVDLLEQIAATGSISAAARSMEMSYKRAWDLVEELKEMFGKPLVAAKTGGKHGGGAELTPIGEEVVRQFRDMERAVNEAAAPHIRALQAEADRR
ncbi:MAG: LysR family transcriptional regulator [Mesorhizobium sp. SCN 65-20]|nr:MAG: LysR family transcriptional regulator [Mesorhizobium sp. SCN 65-20]